MLLREPAGDWARDEAGDLLPPLSLRAAALARWRKDSLVIPGVLDGADGGEVVVEGAETWDWDAIVERHQTVTFEEGPSTTRESAWAGQQWVAVGRCVGGVTLDELLFIKLPRTVAGTEGAETVAWWRHGGDGGNLA